MQFNDQCSLRVDKTSSGYNIANGHNIYVQSSYTYTDIWLSTKEMSLLITRSLDMCREQLAVITCQVLYRDSKGTFRTT